jgi:UDP-2-acetamido-2,6-beta-L-arabino-hexul-4-ose reductase
MRSRKCSAIFLSSGNSSTEECRMSFERATIAVTGAAGFVGSNLVVRLGEMDHAAAAIARSKPAEEAEAVIGRADIVFHLAGANRTQDEAEYQRSNRDYTRWVAEAVAKGGRKPLIVHSGSTKALDDTDYGRSKRAAEEVLLELAAGGHATTSIWRLPNVFGKWARPNYNSAVATFCHNAARGEPLRIDDPAAPMSLLHIDDLIDQWLPLIASPPEDGIVEPDKVHRTTVGEVAEIISGFAAARDGGDIDGLGSGLVGKLYATYVAALPVDQASLSLDPKTDSRGMFVELFRTAHSGQLSFFTVHPGVTRGGHYHHSKVERFVVAQGAARLRFRHVLSGATFEVTATADAPRMVETIPGWTHDVTNIGDGELVVIAWASEVFDPARPDTVRMPL